MERWDRDASMVAASGEASATAVRDVTERRRDFNYLIQTFGHSSVNISLVSGARQQLPVGGR
jgi:hypothetical protein